MQFLASVFFPWKWAIFSRNSMSDCKFGLLSVSFHWVVKNEFIMISIDIHRFRKERRSKFARKIWKSNWKSIKIHCKASKFNRNRYCYSFELWNQIYLLIVANLKCDRFDLLPLKMKNPQQDLIIWIHENVQAKRSKCVHEINQKLVTKKERKAFTVCPFCLYHWKNQTKWKLFTASTKSVGIFGFKWFQTNWILDEISQRSENVSNLLSSSFWFVFLVLLVLFAIGSCNV